MKYILTLLMLFMMSACTVTKPYITEYKIKTEVKPVAFDSQSCKEKTLKISQAFSENAMMTQNMQYSKGDFDVHEFGESQWSQSPNHGVTKEILHSVEASGLFKNVQGYKSRSKSDYVLESSINEFMHYFTKNNKESYVSIAISFTLLDAKNLTPIETKTFKKRVDTDELNARAGVRALNKALGELLEEKNIWLSEVCR